MQESEEAERLEQMIQSLEQWLANLYTCEPPMLLEPQTKQTATRLRLGDDDDVSLPVQ